MHHVRYQKPKKVMKDSGSVMEEKEVPAMEEKWVNILPQKPKYQRYFWFDFSNKLWFSLALLLCSFPCLPVRGSKMHPQSGEAFSALPSKSPKITVKKQKIFLDFQIGQGRFKSKNLNLKSY